MWMPRFRIWTMMVAVVVLALALAASKLARTASERSQVADRYAHQANLYRKSAAEDEKGLSTATEDTRQAKVNSLGRFSRKAAYYSTLEAHYRRAARYPWLPVAPDPPAPD